MNSSDARVTGVTARAVNVPLQIPVRTSVGVVATAPLVLIDLTTNASVGRAYVFTYTPLALAATRALVQALGDALVGQPLAPFDLDAFLAQRLRLLGRTGLALMACAGLDMAAWDALAIQHRLPLVELLGGRRRPLRVYDSQGMDGEAFGVERALRARDEGFMAMKTRLGFPTLAEDLRVVRAIRAAVGPEIDLMVDYNQALDVGEAVRRIRALESEGLAWVEEPTRQDDWQGHADIRRSTALPIQLGENWCGVEEMSKALQLGACDFAMPDAMKIGGVTGWLRAASLAQASGIPMSSHLMQEISAHLLMVTPTAHWLERMEIASAILERPLTFADGHAILPDTPGTGVAWDESAVADYLT